MKDELTLSRPMDDEGADMLAAEIIKQAAMDYWFDCAPPEYKREKNTTDKDYEKFVKNQEVARELRMREERAFFMGEWYRALMQQHHIPGQQMIEQIEYLRSIGKRIFFSSVPGDEAA